MQAVLFEIQLIRSKSATVNSSAKGGRPDSEESVKPGSGNHLTILATTINRRGSHGIKNILLKGEMRYIKDINMLVFLCSPL